MTAQVTVGLDGSDESLAAARWAAGEAALREVPLRLVHVEEWPNTPEIPVAHARALYERAETLLREGAERARESVRSWVPACVSASKGCCRRGARGIRVPRSRPRRSWARPPLRWPRPPGKRNSSSWGAAPVDCRSARTSVT